ncbi:MAG TPA: serine hydrolase domain-containing protein [Steroidobacteraceae bacterium]|nr:serine hydrolase domain-containing protein [Steroidobacteraceae bacterium]
MRLRHGAPQEAGMLPERVDRAREACARWVREGHTPALGVCIARRGVIVLHEAFGVLGPEPDSPRLALDTLFPVMSIAKSITATLVMQLVDDGLLGLNRPAKDYLPEMPGEGTDDILVHHLLTHTSGYPFLLDPPWLEHVLQKHQARFEPPPCPEGLHPFTHKWLSRFWDAPRVGRAGEVMVYSGHNYILLGEIVRRLSGRGLEPQARERLFDPLGMRDSYYVVPASESHRVVQRAPDLPFAAGLGPYPGIGSREMQELPDAQSGVFSTPLDLAAFGQMILNHGRYGDARILSPAAVAAMTRNQIPGVRARMVNYDAEHASWGYGFAVASPTKWKYFDGTLQAPGTLSHSGAGGAGMWIDPVHELAGAYLEVTTRMTPSHEHLWNFDLFQNVITSALDD